MQISRLSLRRPALPRLNMVYPVTQAISFSEENDKFSRELLALEVAHLANHFKNKSCDFRSAPQICSSDSTLHPPEVVRSQRAKLF